MPRARSKRRRSQRSRRSAAAHRARIDGHGGGALGALEASMAGDLQSAAAIIEATVKQARASGDREALAAMLVNLANVRMQRENYKAARMALDEALEVAESIREAHMVLAAHYGSGRASIGMRDFARAREHLRKAAQLAAEQGDEGLAAVATALEGRAFALEGRGEEAIERFILAVLKARLVGEPLGEIMVWKDELREAMGDEAYYGAWDAADKRLGRPLLTHVVETGQLDPERFPGITVEDVRRSLEEE